jgi:hypothetical protein
MFGGETSWKMASWKLENCNIKLDVGEIMPLNGGVESSGSVTTEFVS